MNSLDIITPQSDSIEAEEFQSILIESMSKALLRVPSPPCLLRAPTGAGKTYMISRVLEEVSSRRPTVWLWFVPFVNLVQQTEDALAANCSGLNPVMLAKGRNQETRAGMVLLSTAQGVARARNRNTGYDSDGDDDTRTLAEFVARARSQQLQIGLVVDEAHIGLDKTTEFGKFAHWLHADYLIMATATPKDERLLEFLKEAGMSAFESFAASRDDVVEARLNKRYIEAIVYDLRQSVQTIADLKRTVLRQAWLRSQKLKRELQQLEIALTPLLLVQVANGDKTVEEAEQDLIALCKVHPAAIGKHSSDAPDPVLMAAIAIDASKEVLIFKQSAGTGFDAPRAFVLASTKPVNDVDFAMQFIGRVMRVSRPIRRAFPKPTLIPPELDTAYIYLANAEAQRGFETAVQSSGKVHSQLEGQTEKLIERKTVSGATVYTNRMTAQTPIAYDLPLPGTKSEPIGSNETPDSTQKPIPGSGTQTSWLTDLPESNPPDEKYKLDEVIPFPINDKAGHKTIKLPHTVSELQEWLENKNIRAYPLKTNLPYLPQAFKRERRPELETMGKVSKSMAERLPISDETTKTAVKAALNRLKEKEVHTELTKKSAPRYDDVNIIINRNALEKEARKVLHDLSSQIEEEDVVTIIKVLASRLQNAINETFENIDEEQKPSEIELKRYARDAAYWVIRRQQEDLAELMQSLIAEFTTVEDAEQLPNWMVFPLKLSLAASRKNIYGFMPPSDDDLAQIDQMMTIDERAWLADRSMHLTDVKLQLGKFDGTTKLNGEEREFAKALDRADFVVWWHRNPDRKPYAVRLVRGDHQNYFHPDFVVCLSHYQDDEPTPRLIETKENVKDAVRKARRIPKIYGEVLFLTKDQNQLRVINKDGGLGMVVNWDDLTPIRDWLLQSKPVGLLVPKLELGNQRNTYKS